MTKIISVLTILLVISSAIQTNALVDDVIEVLKLGKDVTTSLLEAWDIIEQSTHNGEGDVEFPFRKTKQKKVLSRIAEVSREISKFETESSSIMTWSIEKITNNIFTNTKLELNLHELSDLMNRIRTRHKELRTFAHNSNDLEQITLQEFAQWTISHDTMAIQGLLDRIHLLVTGSDELRNLGNIGTFELLSNSLEESQSQVCATRQSAQQVLYQLYNAISITEIKGYAMMQFSWMILRTFGVGNFTRESMLAREQFNERINKTQEKVRKVMERAERFVYRCDPRHHVEGETYIQVTRLLQGFIQNEVDMNNDNTCRENCGAYPVAETYGCYKELFCARQPRCSGKLLNCQFFDADMWVCQAKPNSLRRYEFIEYENGRMLGKPGSCAMGTSKVDSWWRWLFWHCSYCMCICDEESKKSDRYFNLRDVVSNYTANYVVTGVRLRKMNRIIHLQIQQGQLLPRGTVNASTVEWVPVHEFKLLDRGIKSGSDYFTMNYTHRIVDLDDIHSPMRKNHVVTGVGFRTIGTHLNLKVRISEIDFVRGTVMDDNSIWISSDNTESSPGNEKRTPVKLRNPDIPTLTKASSEIDSKPNQYIELTHSDLERDAAQTTVPFFDAQDVISNPPVPLSGLGIYHKGQPLYGGFIAMRLMTYNFEPHIQMPEIQEGDDVHIVPLSQ